MNACVDLNPTQALHITQFVMPRATAVQFAIAIATATQFTMLRTVSTALAYENSDAVQMSLVGWHSQEPSTERPG